jgi:hypothetical protein
VAGYSEDSVVWQGTVEDGVVWQGRVKGREGGIEILKILPLS